MSHDLYPEPTLVRRLAESDCSFSRTVFMSNFRRLIEPNVYTIVDIYTSAKKIGNLPLLTDTFWFDAHENCRASYEKLPLVYPFIDMVKNHINNNVEGIYLIDRDKPYFLAEIDKTKPRSICQSFNQLLDFFRDVGVLSSFRTTSSPDSSVYRMEGYIKFKICRGSYTIEPLASELHDSTPLSQRKEK